MQSNEPERYKRIRSNSWQLEKHVPQYSDLFLILKDKSFYNYILIITITILILIMIIIIINGHLYIVQYVVDTGEHTALYKIDENVPRK